MKCITHGRVITVLWNIFLGMFECIWSKGKIILPWVIIKRVESYCHGALSPKNRLIWSQITPSINPKDSTVANVIGNCYVSSTKCFLIQNQQAWL